MGPMQRASNMALDPRQRRCRKLCVLFMICYLELYGPLPWRQPG